MLTKADEKIEKENVKNKKINCSTISKKQKKHLFLKVFQIFSHNENKIKINFKLNTKLIKNTWLRF